METLRNKILTPMVLLVVLVPAATLLFFNIAVNLYIDKTARSELSATFEEVQKQVQNAFKDGVPTAGSVSELLDPTQSDSPVAYFIRFFYK